MGAAAAGVGMAAVSAASADTLNLGQFGPVGVYLPNVITGKTADGVTYTITGPGGSGFVVAQQPDSYEGQFPDSAPVLADLSSGAITIRFNDVLTSLTSFGIEPDSVGTYSATAKFYIYNTSDLRDTLTYNSYSDFAPGTLPGFNYYGGQFNIVVLSNSHGGLMALGSTVVPEPATWAMLILGVAMVGFAARRRREGAALAA